MPRKAIGAALLGAVALSVAAVPSVQADSGPGDWRHSRGAGAGTDSAPAARGAVTPLAANDIAVTDVTVNGGNPVVVGTTNVKTFKVSVTATNPEGIEDGYVDLWHGSDLDNIDGLLLPNEDWATCTAVSATKSTCKLTVSVDPQYDLYSNALAGSWHVTGAALGTDGDVYWNDYYKKHFIKRNARLSVNASPEPVTKGRTMTIKGALTRANWQTSSYKGYVDRPVKLQFRKKGTTTYNTVKTVRSKTRGELKATATARYDGYWRFVFDTNSTTGGAKATGDYVNVR